MSLIDGYYKKHPNVRKIVLLSYEIAIGLMLWVSLHYANDAYAMGAKDCLNFTISYMKFTNMTLVNNTLVNLSLPLH
jgi:hypothetical protein